MLTKSNLENALKLNSLGILFENGNGKRLKFKEFHGLHDDIKIIWKTFNPWPLYYTENMYTYKRHHCFFTEIVILRHKVSQAPSAIGSRLTSRIQSRMTSRRVTRRGSLENLNEIISGVEKDGLLRPNRMDFNALTKQLSNISDCEDKR